MLNTLLNRGRSPCDQYETLWLVTLQDIKIVTLQPPTATVFRNFLIVRSSNDTST